MATIPCLTLARLRRNMLHARCCAGRTVARFRIPLLVMYCTGLKLLVEHRLRTVLMGPRLRKFNVHPGRSSLPNLLMLLRAMHPELAWGQAVIPTLHKRRR